MSNNAAEREIQLVDNATGTVYIMTSADNYKTWSVEVSAGVTDITFNRVRISDGEVRNAWAAGNRGTSTVWCVTDNVNDKPAGYWETSVPETTTPKTIYFDNSKTKWDTVAFYQWSDSSFAGYTVMTQIENTDIWSLEITSNITEGLFKGTDESTWDKSKQTNDVTIDTAAYGNDILFTPSTQSNKWNVTVSAYK